MGCLAGKGRLILSGSSVLKRLNDAVLNGSPQDDEKLYEVKTRGQHSKEMVMVMVSLYHDDIGGEVGHFAV